jgi:hypothetical protein
LIPRSAVDRAAYISTLIRDRTGRILFLGDDDLVSPLVAAWHPSVDVQVLDIDSAVLERAKAVARALGASVGIQHVDLTKPTVDDPASADIVVADPFPSRDGSFEGAFWSRAAEFLCVGGTLVTTVAPSHKPRDFALGALASLKSCGFCLVELLSDVGAYETFAFEFTPYEQRILDALGLTSTVAHTKSLLAAEFLGKHMVTRVAEPLVDFERWSSAALSHYLTVQAGSGEQASIVASRGPVRSASNGSTKKRESGMKVEAIFPIELRDHAQGRVPASPEAAIAECILAVRECFGVETTETEAQELMRLTTSADLASSDDLAQLGLMIRAIESWERWRFDE